MGRTRPVAGSIARRNSGPSTSTQCAKAQITEASGRSQYRSTAVFELYRFCPVRLTGVMRPPPPYVLSSFVNLGRGTLESEWFTTNPQFKQSKRSRFGCEGFVRLPSIATPQTGHDFGRRAGELTIFRAVSGMHSRRHSRSSTGLRCSRH